jgi:chromosomal replication initiator protein
MNARDAWLATLGQLQVQLNRATYDTWLRRAELLGYEDGRFVVTVPNAYARDWLDRHLLPALTETLCRIMQRSVEVQIIVWDPVEPEDDQGGPLIDYASAPRELPAGPEGTLHPDYTFERFIVGEANRYAFLLAQTIVEGPIGKYSPVLFQGAMGVGKTHLLQAIARGLIARGLTVYYLSTEEFTAELVTAIRDRQGAAFRERFRVADAVILDDLQFIEGKDSTQAELVAIWDALRNRGRMMIFAADRLPCDMNRISHDARSRFQAGPIATIDPPDHALRAEFLASRSARRGLSLPPAICELLASRVSTSMRDLESAVEQMAALITLARHPVDEAAAMVLRALGLPARAGAATLEAVMECVARHFALEVEDLTGRRRSKAVVQARQVAMFLARECTDASLPQIGQALGGRDHSTVMHGCARVVELMAHDAGVAEAVSAIRAALRPEQTAAPSQGRSPVQEAVPVPVTQRRAPDSDWTLNAPRRRPERRSSGR